MKTDLEKPQSSTVTTRAPAAGVSPNRLASIDAYRGFVMFLMMAGILSLPSVANQFRESGFWALLGYHQSHVEWRGCSLHDLIQPSFSFIVGVALPFSMAARLARGQTRTLMTLHAFWRAALLVMIGVFLRSVGKPMTSFTFEDTLSQIGLGYGFLFLLGHRPVRDQWIGFGLLLVGYWAAFALYPLPSQSFDYGEVGVSADWLKTNELSGFQSHWNKNANLAWAFDKWFLNLFPRPKPFEFNGGGYATLSFIPTLATMVLGLIAGGVLKSDRSPVQKVRWFIIAGVVSLAAGWLCGVLGICPVVKRIWTPSWTLFSGGWCLLLLALFYLVLDVWQVRGWAFVFNIIGLNSIAAYCMDHLWAGFIRGTLKTHLGPKAFEVMGPAYAPLLQGAAILAVLWLILFWMYRRKIFLRV